MFFRRAQFETVSNSIETNTDKNFLLSPMTSASLIKGEIFILFSISCGETLSPPGVIIISFFLSTIFKNSPSNSPTSPVDNHPFTM